MSALGQKQTYAQAHVRFNPNSDRESGLPQTVMSALGQKRTYAAQQKNAYSITSAVARIYCGMVRPSALAALRLRTVSYFVGACTGRSPGFSPLRIRST